MNSFTSPDQISIEKIMAFLRDGCPGMCFTTAPDEQRNQSENEIEDGKQNFDDITDSENNPSSTEPPTSVSHNLRQLLQKLALAIRTAKPVLDHLAIPVREGDHFLKNLSITLPIDINETAQVLLNHLSSLFQEGMVMTQRFLNICTTGGTDDDLIDPMGEESDESADRITSAPSGSDEHPLPESIQEQSYPVRSTIPKEINFDKSLSDLSQLLLKTRELVQEMQSVEPTIVQQPQELWKKRTLNCLRKGWCAALQGRSGKEKDYIKIKWTKLPIGNSPDLFALIQLLATNDKPHRSNILLPPRTTVKKREFSNKRKRNEKTRPLLKDVHVDDSLGWNPKTNTILWSVSAKENNQCEMSLPVTMIRLYNDAERILLLDDEQEEKEKANPYVADQLLNLSKLRLCLCQRTENGGLACVSNSIVTELIEESKGTKRLCIDASRVLPRKLCSCGNETIIVPLNTKSEKAGFSISLNGEQLPFRQFKGVVNNSICFKSRQRSEPDQQSLHVMISKESISDTIKQNRNPYEGLEKIALLDLKMDYINYSDDPHVHYDTTASKQTH